VAATRFQTVNPASGEVIGEYETITSQQALEVARRAREAFNSWRRLDIGERADYLRRLAGVLRKNLREYAELITLEMGKPIRQARAEVEKCAWTAEVFAENGERWLEEEVVGTDAWKSLVRFEPLGVVLSVMPWNFPFWQPLRFGIPALLAGNVSVLRHSNIVPGCALAIERAFAEAGFPDYVFKTIITDHDVVADLIASRYIDGVSFTGSVAAGARIGELAGRNLKKCVLELGGSDPFIVLEDADMDFTCSNAAQARLVNSGQSCIAAKRFIVVESRAEEFTRLFTEYMGRLVVGDPMDERTDVGPLVREERVRELEAQVEDAVLRGARILMGGRRMARKGFFYEPTVLANVTLGMRVMNEEVFGPVAPIVVARDEAEAIEIANKSEFGLGASIWTRSEEKAMRVAGQLECGIVFVNGMVKSDPRMPFGGVKKSGIGRELSKYGLREFVNIKGITIYEPRGGFKAR
jgi:succinate-semialdehyde dehydrogenase/glutarate-semialdehyde dehydrogenase